MSKSLIDLNCFFKTAGKPEGVFQSIMSFLQGSNDLDSYKAAVLDSLRDLHNEVEIHKAELATGIFDGLTIDNAEELLAQNDELRESLTAFDRRADIIQRCIAYSREMIEFFSSQPMLNDASSMVKFFDDLIDEFSLSFNRTPYIASRNPIDSPPADLYLGF